MISFYLCENSGTLVEVLKDKNELKVIGCNNNELKKLEPNTGDADRKKHMPYVSIKDTTMFIQVGEISHPMTEEHYIKAIYVVDDLENVQKFSLKPGDKPEITTNFNKNAKKIDVYAYCNLHGLWKTEVNL